MYKRQALWAVPVSILASIGMSSSWLLVEIVLSIILIYHGISTLLRGSIIEIEALSKLAHSKLPELYREWRGRDEFIRDTYLGLWLAWLAWVRSPFLIPQGVGSIARSGIIGAFSSVVVLALFILVAGIVVTLVRTLATSFGKTSFILGQMSKGIRPRAWGVASTMFGLWMLISLVVIMLQVGL